MSGGVVNPEFAPAPDTSHGRILKAWPRIVALVLEVNVSMRHATKMKPSTPSRMLSA